MPTVFLEFLWWLQHPASGGGASGGGGEAADAAGGYSCAMQGGLMLVMLVVFYFFMIRPEQKRRKEQEEMLSSIRKGTKVRTAGGILGEVVSVNEGEVILQIAKNVRVNILRSNIATVEADKAAPTTEAKPDTKLGAKADASKADAGAEAEDGV